LAFHEYLINITPLKAHFSYVIPSPPWFSNNTFSNSLSR